MDPQTTRFTQLLMIHPLYLDLLSPLLNPKLTYLPLASHSHPSLPFLLPNFPKHKTSTLVPEPLVLF